jgi:hypothetical protein
MSLARRLWVAFEGWRKRCWLSRVVLLCSLLGFSLYNAWYLPSLVRQACSAILADAEPKVADAIYRSQKVGEVRRLQAALVERFDGDGDGVLSDAELGQAAELGIATECLTAHPLRASLDGLVAAAHKVELLPSTRSARGIRHAAWCASQDEVEQIMAPERARIDSLTAWWRVPGYTSVSTWRTGLRIFYERIVLWGAYGVLGNPFHWIPFFVMTYLVAMIAVILLRGRRVAAALLTAAVVSGAINGLWAAVLPHSVRWYHYAEGIDVRLLIAGDSLLILAVAIVGLRRGARSANRKRALHAAVVVLGLLFVAWGALPTPHPGLRLGRGFQCPFLLNGEVFPSMKVWMCVIGVIVLAAYLVQALRNRRRRQRELAVA